MKNSLFKGLFIALATLGFLAGMGWLMLEQSKAADRALVEISDLRDPSPFRVALTGHLDKIYLNFQAYVKGPNQTLLDQMKTSQTDFERSLHDFEIQSPKLFPVAARDGILQSYELMRNTVNQALETSKQRGENQVAWQTNFDRFLYVIQNRLRPLSKKDREGAVVRNDSLLNLENQWRAWQQSLAQYWADPKPDASRRVQDAEERTESHLNIYEQVASLAVERKQIRELRDLRQNNIRLGRQVGILQKLENDRLNQIEESRKQTLGILAKTLPSLKPEELEKKKEDLIQSIRVRTIAMGGFAFLGMTALIMGILSIYRLWKRSRPSSPLVSTPSSAPEEAVFEMNLKGKIAKWSRGAELFYGYKAKEIEGQSIGILFASEEEIGHLYKELQGGQKSGFDAQHKDKSGDTFAVRIEFKPLKDSSGNAAIRLICRPR